MTWTAPKTWAADELVTATDFNTHLRDNLLALKQPPSQQIVRLNAASYTTTSTSFVTVDDTNLKITLTSYGGDVLIWVNATANTNGSYSLMLTVSIDGVDQGPANGLTYVYGSNVTPLSWVLLVSGIAAGEHSYRLRFRVSGGTGTLLSNANVPVILGVREVS
ncbi:MAG TPA: hypothetical protein VHP83_09450 [Aggregatilineaceae bacterium]|nr:hypothetical protein [Aggregatilineaceae bacterium]